MVASLYLNGEACSGYESNEKWHIGCINMQCVCKTASLRTWQDTQTKCHI